MAHFYPPGHAQGLKKIMNEIFKKPGSIQKKGKRSRTPPPDKRIPLEDAAEFLAEILRIRNPAGQTMSVQQALKQFSFRDKKTRDKLRESFGVKKPRVGKSGRPLRQRDPRTGKRRSRKGGANEPSPIAYSQSQNPDSDLTYEVLESLIRNYRKDPPPYIRSLDLLK